MEIIMVMIMMMYFLLLFLFSFSITNGVAMHIVGYIYVCYISRIFIVTFSDDCQMMKPLFCVPLLLRLVIFFNIVHQILPFVSVFISYQWVKGTIYYLLNLTSLSWRGLRFCVLQHYLKIDNRTTLLHYVKISIFNITWRQISSMCCAVCLKKLHNTL